MLVMGRDDIPRCVERRWQGKGRWWWPRVRDVVAAVSEFCDGAPSEQCPWKAAGGARRCIGWSDAFYIPQRAAWHGAFRRAVDVFSLPQHNTWHEVATPTLLELLSAATGTPLLQPTCMGDCCCTLASAQDVRERPCGHKLPLANGLARAALWAKLGFGANVSGQ